MVTILIKNVYNVSVVLDILQKKLFHATKKYPGSDAGILMKQLSNSFYWATDY